MKKVIFCVLSATSLYLTPVMAADRDHPTVIELYQSQGCSSCPPANANLNALAGRSDVLPLSFAVTYWDYLGWKDTFAKKSYTARQWDYAHSGGRPNVATPQMIVNGVGILNGTRKSNVSTALKRYDRGAAGPDIAWTGGTVSVGSGSSSGTVWLVRFDPRELDVPVRSGENTGRTLPHRNIVKQLVRLGNWNGSAGAYRVPANPDNHLKTALLVQKGRGGPIIAASRQN